MHINVSMKLSAIFLSALMLIFLTFGCAHKKMKQGLAGKLAPFPSNNQAPAATQNNNDFYALQLSGSNEIPVGIETPASGKLFLKANSDSTMLYFAIYVDSLKNITKATINYGTKDYNGPLIVTLYPARHTDPDSLIGRTFSGLLYAGSFTKLYFGEDAFEAKTISDLIRSMRNDSTYIQIHTKYHRDGIIRAQIKAN